MMLRACVSLFCVAAATLQGSAPREVHPLQPIAGAAAAARSAVQPLPFSYDLYTFRGTGDSTAIVASFAVEAGGLEREQLAGEVRYRFDVSLVLADTVLRTVSRTDDSVYVRVSRPLAHQHLLYTQIGVNAAPSSSTVQRVIMTDASTPGIGQLYTSWFPIPDYSGTGLMLSDVALAQPETPTGWPRGDVRLALLPTSQLPASAFDVYYEVYNLPRGHAYVTEIAVEPVDEERPDARNEVDAVRIRYPGEASPRAGDTLRELRHVDASVARGRYRITVTVTDEVTGESAQRSRVFEVRGWVRGATPVAALPRGESYLRSLHR